MSYDIIHTKHDGNCLFEALCIGLHLLEYPGAPLDTDALEQQKWNLRQSVASIICTERKEHFHPFCVNPERIREDGEWAGHHELVAFSDKFEINIVLHDQNDDWDTLIHIPSEILPYHRTITLRREGKTHYNLVCVPGTPDPRVADMEYDHEPAKGQDTRSDPVHVPWWKRWFNL